MKVLFFSLLTVGSLALGQENHHSHHMSHNFSCSEEEYFDPSMAMCIPRPGNYIGTLHTMIHANAFIVGQSQSGPRGRNALAAPHMLMVESGTSLDSNNYLNLELMLTAERWTFPNTGYPELLQVGEENAYGQPYIDAQHPHSSPFMGITLSDTIRLPHGDNHAKIFFAPRGASTAGPIAFMHRPTGMVNPDAPLGHHVGQDSGHITSTIMGGAVQLGGFRIEISAFNGSEPHPTEVDLPIGRINSFAGRLTYEFSPSFLLMGSAAHITSPEPHETSIANRTQYSLSAYTQHRISENLDCTNAFILGTTRDNIGLPLRSIGEEFLFPFSSSDLWGRFEFLERRPGELLVASSEPETPQWVTALTLGYTYNLLQGSQGKLGLGTSVTHDLLPAELAKAYGGNPWTGRIFLRLMGMDSFNL